MLRARMTLLLFILVLLIPLCLGVALVHRGWRGVAIDDHPLCRRCGFDLTGKPSDSDRCAECGADVSAPKSIRRGHRRRRRGQLLFGVAMLVLVLCAVAGVATYVLRTIDPNTIKPVWWLALDAESPNRATNSAALKELARRVNLGQLSGGPLAKLVNRALAHQADASHAWVNEWGDIVQLARRSRGSEAVTDEQWARFGRRALEGAVRLRVRPNVRRGDPIPWSVAFGGPGWRGGNSSGLLWYEARSDVSVASPLGLPRADYRWDSFLGNGNLTRLVRDVLTLTPAQVENLSDGPQKLSCNVHVDVREFRGSESAPILSSFDLPLGASWVLLPPDQLTAPAKHAPELTAAIRAALSIRELRLLRKSNSMILNVTFLPTPAPAALAFDLIVRDPRSSREAQLGTMIKEIGASGPIGVARDVPADLARAIADSKTADVIFRPSPNAAVRSVDLTEYWTGDEPIIFENVPVKVEQSPR
jgi:hypothetical protein